LDVGIADVNFKKFLNILQSTIKYMIELRHKSTDGNLWRSFILSRPMHWRWLCFVDRALKRQRPLHASCALGLEELPMISVVMASESHHLFRVSRWTSSTVRDGSVSWRHRPIEGRLLMGLLLGGATEHRESAP
jgi:hypothetical protein